MKRYAYVAQIDMRDCGVAALASIAKHYGSDFSLAHLRELAKTTKEGFLYHILIFLQKQGLIDYVEEDEMIKTTKKLDSFMDWNLLNQNNYDRVRKILGVTEDE